MSNPHTFTLGQAAEATGKSKATISRALNSGKLSYRDKTDAGYVIDAAELFRVFPVKLDETPPMERSGTPESFHETKLLQAEIDSLKEHLREKNEMIADLREDRDDWKEQAKTALRQLTDQRERTSGSEQSIPEPQKPAEQVGIVRQWFRKVW